MITPLGLQDQILNQVVKLEKPELAKEKEQLILSGAENAKSLSDCENKILQILSSSSGNILEDENAIDTLKSSKVIADDIKIKQETAKVTEKKIDETRSKYVNVAFHAQLLYFITAELANVEPTYQYSLSWFLGLCSTSVSESEKSSVLEQRLKLIKDYFTYYLYCNVCRSLLEKDKLTYSFLLTMKILQGNGRVDNSEWYFLLTGGVTTENSLENPAKEWLNELSWSEICRLEKLSSFLGLTTVFLENLPFFKAIYDSTDAHRATMPGIWETKLGSFQKLLITRCLRPDKLVLGIQDYIVEQMGEKFVNPPTFNLRTCFNDSTCCIPLVFVLSAGADPMTNILKLSETEHYRVDSISLGQGQGPKAEVMIKNAVSKEGEKIWIVLQNCHLATSWMSKLETIVESIQIRSNSDEENRVNQNFRLWLTTYPTDDFPVSILQNSVKMTLEPPKGLRQNLLSSYRADPISDMNFFNSVKRNDGNDFKKLLYTLCFFHALVQERREYGSLGWNIPYDFSNSDLIISVRQLAIFIDLYEEVPFKCLNYCTGECNYGGRVTDDKDRRFLMTVLGTFYSPLVLVENQSLSGSGLYRVPPNMEYERYLEFIQSLPLATEPEVFGLNENANLTKGQRETRLLCKTVLLTQKVVSSGDKEDGEGDGDSGMKTEEDIIYDIAEDILGKLPDLYDIEFAELKYPVKWEESMNTVLVQELVRFNKLNAVVRDSLKEVKKAVRGIVVMSGALELVANSLLLGRVPGAWLISSYPSLKPLSSYVKDLLRRMKFLATWLYGEIPISYWLSGFFFTQAFLTGTLQNFARKYGIPIDDVDFDFKMLRLMANQEDDNDTNLQALGEKPIDGAYVYGLYIDGARFCDKEGLLKDAFPKILFSAAPIMWLVPMKKQDIQPVDFYDSPVYKTSERRGILSTTGHSTNFVMNIRIPTTDTQTKWILAGVALLTQLDL
eukprot:augustus_masked-scaffold_6-processed-gene-16.8-mRNA-1 protein AED:0.39 eAED:0.39 QI:0/-1/0/1/-1/1/1/0/953